LCFRPAPACLPDLKLVKLVVLPLAATSPLAHVTMCSSVISALQHQCHSTPSSITTP
jgi:hypothetical protein